MREQLKPALLMFLWLSLLCGVAYPLLVTAIAQAVFPAQANGSLIGRDGKAAASPSEAVGSSLIGQSFSGPGYFWSRPSATSPAYNAAASSGSNFGPLNEALTAAVAERVASVREESADASSPVPVDLVTASGSGLDPHISPAAALFQVERVARERGMERERVEQLVRAAIEGRSLGVLGEPRVNVLLLNLALDSLSLGSASETGGGS
jgi:K+-transporting ATPase ATPase C chain